MTPTAPPTPTTTHGRPPTVRYLPALLLGTYLATLGGVVAVALLGALYAAELALPLAVHLALWGLALGTAVAAPALARGAVATVDDRLAPRVPRVPTVITAVGVDTVAAAEPVTSD